MRTFDELQALIIQRGVHAEFGAVGEGWGIEQSPYELSTFLVRMQELGVQSVLEIGTGYKGGLSRFLAGDMGWRTTTVDVVDYEHNYKGVEYVAFPEVRYVQFGYGVSFDLVFIDGAHDYDSVVHDYSHYGHLAKKVIAFHDIMGKRGCEGAEKYWNEFFNANIDKVKLRHVAKDAGIGWIEL